MHGSPQDYKQATVMLCKIFLIPVALLKMYYLLSLWWKFLVKKRLKSPSIVAHISPRRDFTSWHLRHKQSNGRLRSSRSLCSPVSILLCNNINFSFFFFPSIYLNVKFNFISCEHRIDFYITIAFTKDHSDIVVM